MKSKKNCDTNCSKVCSKNHLLAGAVIAASCFAVYVAYNTHCRDYEDAVHGNYSVPAMTDKQIFTEINDKHRWSELSGPEIKKDEQGRHPFVDYLQEFIATHNISSIFDMGCGYGELLKDLNLPNGTNYLGLDIVDSIIAYNKLHYERANVSYDVVDDVKALSKYKGDLLILKDVIQHWSNEQIIYARDHIIPNFRYAIIINNIHFSGLGPVNSEIKTGGSRPLNLEISPFYMKLKVVKDYSETPSRVKRIYLYENDTEKFKHSL